MPKGYDRFLKPRCQPLARFFGGSIIGYYRSECAYSAAFRPSFGSGNCRHRRLGRFSLRSLRDYRIDCTTKKLISPTEIGHSIFLR